MIISVEIVASCSHEEENKGVGRQKQTQDRKTTYYMHVSKAMIQDACCIKTLEWRCNSGSFILLEEIFVL